MITLLHISILLSFGIFLIPRKWKYAFIILLDLLLIVGSTVWAIEAFQSPDRRIVALGVSTWSGELLLVIDKLSAFFIFIINLICLSGMIYAGGYLKPYIQKKRAINLSLHLFSFLWLHISMVLAASFQDGIAFLLGWELMSLFSFILVVFEGAKESTLKSGINYLIQMHLGFALIMFGFLLLNFKTGEMSFDSLNLYFTQFENTGLFLMFFAGFGIKAGFIPLHTWLPRAHPAAPSHVSAVMSGVMIKMGIYGIFRVVSYLHHDIATIGSIVLIVSLASGLLGVVLAVMQHDLKKLLAYHSIENIGIIGIGIGLAILGTATHDPALTAMALGGALLHTLNHALFKSLLFFAAGNVYFSAHTVNMDHLGGLSKSLRLTSIIFLVGALAISGIPPFNGFISEFLLYKGITESLTTAGFSISLAGLTAFVSLVMIGGLCIYCFTKAFGLTFLGTRRTDEQSTIHEVSPVMLAPAVLLLVAILLIGFFPSYFVDPIIQITGIFNHLNVDVTALQQIKPTLRNIGMANGILILIILIVFGVRRFYLRKVTVTSTVTWGCGYSAGDYRHQYTPSSYANNVREMVSLFVASDSTYTSPQPHEIFPPVKKFKLQTHDRIEKSFIMKLLQLPVDYLPRVGFTQTGLINHYLIYPLAFLIIFGLLTFLNYL